MQTLPATVPALSSIQLHDSPHLGGDTAGCLIQLVSADWRITFANDVFASAVSRPLAEVIGSDLRECLPGISETPFFSVAQACMEQRRSRKYVGTFSSSEDPGRLYISELHPYADGLMILSTESGSAPSSLREANVLANVGKMAMGIAYQINNVLNTVVLLTDALERRWENGTPPGDLFGKMSRALEQGTSIADRLAHLNLGALHHLAVKGVSVNRTAEDAVELCQAALLQRSADVTLSLSLNATRDLRMSASVLMASLVELIMNAIEAIPSQGQVTVRTGGRSGRVFIEVEDDGPGMSDEVKERAFEPFFTTKGGRGNGLGLWMVKQFVLEHHGQVEVSTHPGKGALFRMEFPSAPPR